MLAKNAKGQRIIHDYYRYREIEKRGKKVFRPGDSIYLHIYKCTDWLSAAETPYCTCQSIQEVFLLEKVSTTSRVENLLLKNQFFEYSPEISHGTWKWWFPKGISFSRDFFSGSMLKFRGVHHFGDLFIDIFHIITPTSNPFFCSFTYLCIIFCWQIGSHFLVLLFFQSNHTIPNTKVNKSFPFLSCFWNHTISIYTTFFPSDKNISQNRKRTQIYPRFGKTWRHKVICLVIGLHPTNPNHILEMVGKRTPSWWVSPLERHVAVEKTHSFRKKIPQRRPYFFSGGNCGFPWNQLKHPLLGCRKFVNTWVMSCPPSYFCVFFGKNRGPFWTGAPPEIHPTSPLINPTALPKTVPKHPTWNSETARGLDPFAFRHRQCHRPTLRRPTPLPGREAWAADSEVSTPEDSLESLPGFGSLGELGVLVGYRPLRLGVRGFSWLDGASW